MTVSSAHRRADGASDVTQAVIQKRSSDLLPFTTLLVLLSFNLVAMPQTPIVPRVVALARQAISPNARLAGDEGGFTEVHLKLRP